MTYTAEFGSNTIHTWKSYKNSNFNFNDYLLNLYPDLIVSVRYTYAYNKVGDNFARTIVFKSEAHYTWFLLQQ